MEIPDYVLPPGRVIRLAEKYYGEGVKEALHEAVRRLPAVVEELEEKHGELGSAEMESFLKGFLHGRLFAPFVRRLAGMERYLIVGVGRDTFPLLNLLTLERRLSGRNINTSFVGISGEKAEFDEFVKEIFRGFSEAYRKLGNRDEAVRAVRRYVVRRWRGSKLLRELRRVAGEKVERALREGKRGILYVDVGIKGTHVIPLAVFTPATRPGFDVKTGLFHVVKPYADLHHVVGYVIDEPDESELLTGFFESVPSLTPPFGDINRPFRSISLEMRRWVLPAWKAYRRGLKEGYLTYR